MWMGGQGYAPATLPLGKRPGNPPPLREAGWTLGSFWMVAKSFAPTGFRFPHSPVRSTNALCVRNV